MPKTILFTLVISVLVLTGCTEQMSQGDKQTADQKTSQPTTVKPVGEELDDSKSVIIKYAPPSDNWIKAEFPWDDYGPETTVYYPDNWLFDPGYDAGGASWHYIWPTKEAVSGQPSIKISDYSFGGCPDDKPKCGMGEQIVLTPSKKHAQLKNQFLETYTFLNALYLENIKMNTDVFERTREGKVKERLYLMSDDKEVISFTFYDYDTFGEKFVNEFLNKLE